MPDAPAKDDSNFDSPWKDAIQLYLPQFLRQCFPDVEADIDWSRAPEFLDQELRELIRDAAVGPQRVDQLIRVWRLDGVEQWVLLHVEVQSQPDRKLPERLFHYYCRLVTQYGGPVVTLCVLADPKASFRPVAYESELWGCAVHFRFPNCKLLDFADEVLANSPNPIAVVIRAHRVAHRTRKSDPERLELKLLISQGLDERGYSQDDIWHLLRLVDWLIALPRPSALEFRRQMGEYKERKRMPYITTFERFAKEEGREEGRIEGFVESLLQTVTRRFGELPEGFAAQLSQVQDEELLREVFNLAWDSSSLASFSSEFSMLMSRRK